jgi:predicted DNA-binding transcriptional regulator YafY
MNELFVDRIITIMQAIHLEQAVEFNYYKVDQGAISEGNEIVYRCVYPLQIRVFEGRYYLVGLRTEKEPLSANVEHFPIDRMHRRVDLAVDSESEQPVKFNWADLAEAVDFDHLFAYRIGMYRGYGDQSEPQYVYRWFKGWAASFVQAVPLHSSQEIVQQNGGEIRIRIYVVPTPDLENVFRKYGEFSWEG